MNLVAPGLFHEHLSRFGMMSPEVTQHAEEAFSSSFAIAITVAMLASLLAAGLVSWFLVRRVARPVEELAVAAETVAGGTYTVAVPTEPFASELEALSTSFAHMADRLAETETSRTRLLADLAHELRTPLATLEAYIDGLEDGVVAPSEESYATMRGQVSRLRRLATDLRESAAADEHALHLTPVVLDARGGSRRRGRGGDPALPGQGGRAHPGAGADRPPGVGGRRAARPGAVQPARQRPAAHPARRPRPGRRHVRPVDGRHHGEPTTGTASRPTRSGRSSSGSTGSTRPGPAPTGPAAASA